MIFGTNEERGCDCIKHYVEAGEEHPVLGITPDAEYPLIFFEKGMTTVIGGKKHPKQGKIRVRSFHGGTAGNIVPCIVSWYWKENTRYRIPKEFR